MRMHPPATEDQIYHGAGWSSPVARQAHNLKVVGSNPTPATNLRSKKTNNVSNGRQKIACFQAFISCNMVSNRIITAQVVTMRFVGKFVGAKLGFKSRARRPGD